LFFFIH
jgi:hypothetical protein